MVDAETLKEGDRVKLLLMPNDPDPIPEGTLGTVLWVSDLTRLSRNKEIQVGVDWDNGRRLSCICPPDILVTVTEEEDDEESSSD